jgi:hypothetical protein
MKIITPGHRYSLKNFESGEETQTLQFIEKEPTEKPGELLTVNDGTTNEEILEMLIDRLQFLYQKFPSRETAISITHLETALLWLEKRTRDRIKRNVEGKHLA